MFNVADTSGPSNSRAKSGQRTSFLQHSPSSHVSSTSVAPPPEAPATLRRTTRVIKPTEKEL